MSAPQMRSALAMKSGPFLASRQAAVAMAKTRPTLLDATQRPESPQRRQRLGNRILGQEAGALHLAAEPAQRLLVEDRDEAARHRLIDDETNRVRTDVDDGDAGSALARSLHSRSPL